MKILFTVMVYALCVCNAHGQNVRKKINSETPPDTTIYAFTVDSIAGGNPIQFSSFRGKKILVVNSATLDKNFSQLFELQKLQQRQNGALVVILFPSNDFNTEPANEKQVAAFMSRFHFPFVVAAKTHVSGRGVHPVYQWLTRRRLINEKETEVKGAFQKFLVNENGLLEDVFLSTKRPLMDSTIRNVIVR